MNIKMGCGSEEFGTGECKQNAEGLAKAGGRVGGPASRIEDVTLQTPYED